MSKMSELHIKMRREFLTLEDELIYKEMELMYDENMNEELICEHCNWPITDDDLLEIQNGLFIHASCEIEYYSGLK